jgi:hypothetical protein
VLSVLSPRLQREKCSPSSTSRLTLPSRGQLPGYALQLPLMSNVRALVSNTSSFAGRRSSSPPVSAKSMATLEASRRVPRPQSKGLCVPRGSAVAGPALLRRAGSQVGSGASCARAASVAAFGHALARRMQMPRSEVAIAELSERLAVFRTVEYHVVECFKHDLLSPRCLT